MGRPKKAAVASRANGGRAKNKGTRVCKPIWMLHVRYAYDLRPPYYTVSARPQTYADIGMLHYVKPSDIAEKELKVFEFCCRNRRRGSGLRFALGASDKKQRLAVVRAEKRQEEAAQAKAVQLFNQCAGMDTLAKLAKLKKITHGSELPIRFPDLEDA